MEGREYRVESRECMDGGWGVCWWRVGICGWMVGSLWAEMRSVWVEGEVCVDGG